MERNKKTYSVFQLASAVIMILALLWLTVSTPFVYASQQELAKQSKVASTDFGTTEEETNNSPSNTTEEKKPSGSSSVSEEYLHNHHSDDHRIAPGSQFHKSENTGVYNAFHGEVHVPPPNVA